MRWLLFGVLVVAVASIASAKECLPKKYLWGNVCVCNATYCDDLGIIEGAADGSVVAVRSGLYNQLFKRERYEFEKRIYEHRIDVNHNNITYQMIKGWGGAFTDATAINIFSINDDAAKTLIESFFAKNGLEFNMGRVPVGGTDFSTHAYSYDDGDDADPELKNFKLADEDKIFRIPLIKKALALTNLDLFASTWTAPNWMKTTGKYTSGEIKPEFFQAWADYHMRFLDEYARQGIDFWGITTGNEPSLAAVPFNKINSVGWNTKTMHDYVKNHLGPAIRNSAQFKHLKIMLLDDQRFFLPFWPSEIMKDGVEQFIDGIAVHWYWDWLIPASVLDATHKQFPDKFLINTESCRGDRFFEPGVTLGNWQRAEDYAHGIIQDFQNWVTGWIDWNMALDVTGGPTYINNNVDAPIIVNATGQEFYRQPIYYALAHFSKFIPKGSVRIDVEMRTTLEVIAFRTPSDETVIVLLNIDDSVETLSINDPSKGHINIKLQPKSLVSLIYKN